MNAIEEMCGDPYTQGDAEKAQWLREFVTAAGLPALIRQNNQGRLVAYVGGMGAEQDLDMVEGDGCDIFITWLDSLPAYPAAAKADWWTGFSSDDVMPDAECIVDMVAACEVLAQYIKTEGV